MWPMSTRKRRLQVVSVAIQEHLIDKGCEQENDIGIERVDAIPIVLEVRWAVAHRALLRTKWVEK